VLKLSITDGIISEITSELRVKKVGGMVVSGLEKEFFLPGGNAMVGLWMGGLQTNTVQPSQHAAVSRVSSQTQTLKRTVDDLEHHVARLSLLNQALWELIRDRLKLSDADLERIAREIDLRDGVEDGKITDVAMKCPNCGRVSNSKHYRCLYCGLQFEKPVMG